MILLVSISASHVHAHTLDQWGDYRLEIAWEHNPAFTGDLNAIILYVSPLIPGLELNEQPFENGIEGLEDTLKMQLATRYSSIMLFLDPDPKIPGVYRAYVKITAAGYYQANVLGTIGDKPISLSMHPPQVRDTEHVAFPQDYDQHTDIHSEQAIMRSNITALSDMYEKNAQLYQDHIKEYQTQVGDLESRIADLERSDADMAGQYLGIFVGLAGIGMAAFALYRVKSK